MRWSERNPLNRLAGIATSQGTTLKTQPCGEGGGSQRQPGWHQPPPSSSPWGWASLTHPHGARPQHSLPCCRISQGRAGGRGELGEEGTAQGVPATRTGR